MINEEIWKAVVGLEGYYEVSTHGNVRSLTRRIASKNSSTYVMQGRQLKLVPLRNGYFKVCMQVGGIQTNCTVHRLVAQAFIPNPDNLPDVLHSNYKIQDNEVSNLKWGVHADHLRDKPVELRNAHIYLKGEHHPRACSSEETTAFILRRLEEGTSAAQLSRELGVSPNTILRIRHGKHWSCPKEMKVTP